MLVHQRVILLYLSHQFFTSPGCNSKIWEIAFGHRFPGALRRATLWLLGSLGFLSCSQDMPRWAMAYHGISWHIMAYHGIMALAGMVLGRIVQITYGQARLQSLPQDAGRTGPGPHSAEGETGSWGSSGWQGCRCYTYLYSFFWLVSSLWLWCIHAHRNTEIWLQLCRSNHEEGTRIGSKMF